MHSFALGLVEGVKVNRDYHTLELVLVSFIAIELIRLSAVDDKLLRDRQRLNDYIGHDYILVRDLEFMPRLAFVI